MSQENVDLLRRMIETFNRGDLEAVIALADPPAEFEFVPSGVVIPDLADVQRGADAVRRVAEVFWGEFDNPRFDAHEYIDAGDHVFVWTTLEGRGKHSGAETSWDVWSVWTVRDGRMVRWQTFTTRDAALEAVGLRE
jgi:ketosteroid isomerase-like protein